MHLFVYKGSLFLIPTICFFWMPKTQLAFACAQRGRPAQLGFCYTVYLKGRYKAVVVKNPWTSF